MLSIQRKLTMNKNNITLAKEAKRILYFNIVDSQYTKAGSKLYPHQWLWDTCFIAMGYSHFDNQQAKKEIIKMLKAQWKNGLVPHIKYNSKKRRYYPALRHWKIPTTKLTSGITQPPMLAIAAWEIYKKDKDKTFLKKVYPKIKKYHKFLRSQRGGDLLFIIHPWESGMDNTPVYFDVLKRVKDGKLLKADERIDNKIIPKSQRPTKEFYDKAMSLVHLFGEYRYDIDQIKKHSEFIIEDVLFNSIWCEANLCLNHIAKVLGRNGDIFLKWRRQTIIKMRQKLFKNFYFNFDVKGNSLISKKSCIIFLPLFAGIATQKQAAKIVKAMKSFTLKFPVCSYDPKAPEFNPKKYWRGSVWVNINWFLIRGLYKYGYKDKANEIKIKTIELIKDNGFYEYFNPITGEGYGDSQQSWTAALLIDLLLNPKYQ
jgi:glycogen debranching enzyme